MKDLIIIALLVSFVIIRPLVQLYKDKQLAKQEMKELKRQRDEFNKQWRAMSSDDKRKMQQAYHIVTGL